MGYKFRNKYMTKSISETLPMKIQMALWMSLKALIEEGVELDYLQIYRITRVELTSSLGLEIAINIQHEQEQPEEAFDKEYYLTLENNDENNKFEDCKVYIIDDGSSESNATMIFAQEY